MTGIQRPWGIAIGITAALIAAVGLVLAIANHEGERAPSGKAVWTPRSFYGVNAPLLRNYATPQAARALDALAASMASAGVSWARVTIDPSVEQRTPGATSWQVPDAVVGALARHGVRVQALIYGTPGWMSDPDDYANCGLRAEPQNVGAWSRFVAAAVARYGRDGDFWSDHPELRPLPIETWEIANEENTHVFWCPEASPEKYAELYSASRSAALDADPEALVIVGGLAPAIDGAGPGDVTVGSFLRRMVEADPSLPGEIPGVAIHPYAQTVDQVTQTIGSFRDAMRRARLGDTPMLANEVGWYTSGTPGPLLTTQAERAARIRQLALTAQYTGCHLVALGIHSWMTAESDPANPEDWYGLANPITGSPNASGVAYGAAIHAADSEAPAAVRDAGHVCD
jgi:polysaccharide biosynthesis protein PslG